MSETIGVPSLLSRASDSHKGTFGRVLIVGGSRGMSGAVALSGTSALRAGAGLLTIAVPDRCLETVAGFEPNYMTVPLLDDDAGRVTGNAASEVMQLAERMTSIGIGPGLSQSSGITEVVQQVYTRYTGPMVVDADALNALASLPTGLPQAAGPRILTPHLGEFRRLTGRNVDAVEGRKAAVDFAAANGVIVVLKGPGTLVTDGTLEYTNTTGNPGMATGGAGDVLTGVIAALLSQPYSTFEAAILGVYLHGLAGDIARDQFGETSMVAHNIRDCLSSAFRKNAG